MKIESSLQILEKSSNIKFHDNPFIGSRVIPCGRTDRRKDMTKLIVAFINFTNAHKNCNVLNTTLNTGLSKKMDGIWNRYNLKSTGRIYTFGVLKCSEKFKVLDLP